MKVVVKKVDEIRHELNFEIPPDRVKAKLDEVYQKIGKEARIKGFRPGKVPRPVLERHHSRTAQEEMIRGIIAESYQEGIRQENLHPIDYPEVEDVNYKDGVVTFRARMEVYPKVSITSKDYKGIKVKRKAAEVSEDEIDKTLEYFKQGQGEGAVIDDAFARGMGYPGLEDFRKRLARQIEVDKDRQNKADVESQIVDALIERTKFMLPESLVRRQMEQQVERTMEHWKKHHQLSAGELKEKEDEVRAGLKDAVEKNVRVYFILEAIAHEEQLIVPNDENLSARVMEFLLKEADWS
jgi:FKBP-type peptidyl-prolyl cis-trans isomerase (trigger factor)